ncbi:sodium-coupled monocarboxylate transporter 2-like [Haemaphysalis longicornis]
MKSLDTADCAVFGILTALGYITGLYFSFARQWRRQAAPGDSELEEFLGGRSLPAAALVLSVLASIANGVIVVSFVGHYYAHGFNLIWSLVPTPAVAAFSSVALVPLLYQLGVPSVFQYLRMRFNNKVGITACIVYFALSQTLGAVGIYSAAVGISTLFQCPLIYSSIAVGLAGTIYTALGGLRGVVWADCIQALVMFGSPLTMIAKILYDSSYSSPPLRTMRDFNFKEYMFRTKLDFTSDENLWSGVIGGLSYNLVRMAFDQMTVQRFMAARTLRDAKRVAMGGAASLLFFVAFIASSGAAFVYWYRDCDPVLHGAIKSYDQIVPYYVRESLSDMVMLRGLFLAGLVGATTSTVSSVVNSQAATFYIDIVAPHAKLNERTALYVMRLLAFASGTIMTLYALAVPYLGTAARLFLSFYSSCSGPFAGLLLLAISSPWINAKGAAWSCLVVCGLQLWHAVGRTMSGIAPPPFLPKSLDRCSPFSNNTNITAATLDKDISFGAVFPVYQLSFFWSSFFGTLVTIFLGNAISFYTGGIGESRKNLRLTSVCFLNLWQRSKFLRRLIWPEEEAKMYPVRTSSERIGDDEELVSLHIPEVSIKAN